MRQYLDLMQQILETGTRTEDRTGTGTISIFGTRMEFDLRQGFPAITTKKIHMKSVIHELLWFLKGSTNTGYLEENGVKIWREWAKENGDVGPIYGSSWRRWGTPEGGGIDQLARCIQQLKTNPTDRRMIVSAWNVSLLDQMALPPCHLLFQFYSQPLTVKQRYDWAVKHIGDPNLDVLKEQAPRAGLFDVLRKFNVPERGLHCQMYQRSCDFFLGVPFNIASYSLLTMMVAQVTNHIPRRFVWVGGDTHLYLNHLEQANMQLAREPLTLPTMVLNPAVRDIDDFEYDDFKMNGYDAHPHIKAEVSA